MSSEQSQRYRPIDGSTTHASVKRDSIVYESSITGRVLSAEQIKGVAIPAIIEQVYIDDFTEGLN